MCPCVRTYRYWYEKKYNCEKYKYKCKHKYNNDNK